MLFPLLKLSAELIHFCGTRGIFCQSLIIKLAVFGGMYVNTYRTSCFDIRRLRFDVKGVQPHLRLLSCLWRYRWESIELK